MDGEKVEQQGLAGTEIANANPRKPESQENLNLSDICQPCAMAITRRI